MNDNPHRTFRFPFTAVIGLDLVKRSLLYHAVDPRLGGLLLMGHRGCAKSTLARAFGEILPPSENFEKTPSKTRFVEVPLGATEDRLLGSIDASRLLENGEWSAQSGLIQQADGGVFYIDEVNLLPDHLVDSILDSAASGQHRIERDGLSKTVSARYILIGSMNPEEGDLRPQLLDRFTHGILVRDDFSVEERREIVRARMDFDDAPERFLAEHQILMQQLRKQILAARRELLKVEIPESLRTAVAEKAALLKMEGIRAELGVLRTARCAAVWRGDDVILDEDVAEAWVLCLGHRQEQKTTRSGRSGRPPAPDVPPQSPPGTAEVPKDKKDKPEAKHLQMPKTSSSPTTAQTDEISIAPAQNLFHSELSSWWETPQCKQPPEAFISGNSRSVPAHLPHARLCWSSSLTASLRQGWSPGKAWCMRFRKSARRANFWLFLDASRSTGALRFLAEVRNAVQTLGAKTFNRRFHVLILQNGKADWRIKRGTAQAVRKVLAQLTEASGKSPLTPTVNQLRNAIQKQGLLTEDRVLFCSDGMLSPEAGKSGPYTVTESKERFRKALQNLTLRVRNVAWLHPQLRRGMRHWLPNLVEGSPVKLIAVSK